MSASQWDQLEVLARLEYAVKRGMARDAALAEARRAGIAEHLLDSLTKQPGSGGTTVIGDAVVRISDAPTATPPDTPTNAFLRTLPFSAQLAGPRLTFEQAAVVCAHAGKHFGFPFILDWDSDSTRIEVDVKDGELVMVPGGLVRAPGMTADALALILAHERGHRVLESKNEARADFWAARYGVRMLWPDASHDELLRRGFLAAYAVCCFVGEGSTQPLQLLTDDDPKVTVTLSGYPTLQGRWELFKAGLLERDMPPVNDELREFCKTP